MERASLCLGLSVHVFMAPSKAVAWPDEIYDDEDVMSLDAQGRFIICRVCAESFIVYGGKTPKPVTMNACFRIRAWETHKRRTRAHRMKESRDTDSGFPQRRSSDSDLGSVPSVRSTRGGQGSTIFEQYVDNANSYRLNAQSFPVTAVDPTRFMGLPSFEDLAASVGESSSTSQRWSQPKSKRLEAALPSLPRDFARAFTQEHADFHSREVNLCCLRLIEAWISKCLALVVGIWIWESAGFGSHSESVVFG